MSNPHLFHNDIYILEIGGWTLQRRGFWQERQYLWDAEPAKPPGSGTSIYERPCLLMFTERGYQIQDICNIEGMVCLCYLKTRKEQSTHLSQSFVIYQEKPGPRERTKALLFKHWNLHKQTLAKMQASWMQENPISECDYDILECKTTRKGKVGLNSDLPCLTKENDSGVCISLSTWTG